MYTKEEDIIHFIFLAFHGMERKKEKIGMAFHSIMVGTMLKNVGYPEKVVYIGYLHDIIEDTQYTYDYLLNKYGKEIADGVKDVSDLKTTGTWREKKEAFINQLKNSNKDIIAVELADKLQNLLSDYELFLGKGQESLLTESDSLENFKWYYTELQHLFNEKLESNELLDRYNDIINIYFGINN